MSLAERLSHRPVDPTKQYCEVGKVLDRLLNAGPADDPASDFVALVGALVDPDWPAPAISMALVDEGFGSVSTRHIRQHRRGEHDLRGCAMPETGRIKS